MTLQQMLYVLTVAKYGSMNKAAEKLFIVQPTLSNAIQELEKEVGLTIFLRTHRGVVPTPEGREFLADIRQLYQQYHIIEAKYAQEDYRRQFGVSTQHYAFAVQAFIQIARKYGTKNFNFALRETQTGRILADVGSLRSEVGVLYLSKRNRKALEQVMRKQDLEFYPLRLCKACVTLWQNHPLAGKSSISLAEVQHYPCISFEQDEDSPYFTEEIFSDAVYPQLIKVSDRSTMINLMIELHGYTISSGVILDGLNDSGFVAVPFRGSGLDEDYLIKIGYVLKKHAVLSRIGEEYLQALKQYC